MAVITDNQKIQEVLNRGVENVYPNAEFVQSRLESGEQLKIYVGFDPTAPTLHIGNGIQLLKLRQFQELGHSIIFLVGDFTGMIGDPTDKGAARTRLTAEEVKENCAKYKEQASAILDFGGHNPAQIMFNNDWLGAMSFAEVVELASHFTVQRLLERDMFETRMQDGKPIYLHEFLYPIMQGYDTVAMDVDGEIGGNDQTFNMLAGRTLMKGMKQKEKFVLTTQLLTDNSGKKMGKSEGNMIAFSDSPEDMFGKVMSWSDDMIGIGFELCTNLPAVGVAEIHKQIADGANPRDMKLRLATAVTTTFLGEEAAQKGFDHFSTVIQGGGVPEDMEEFSAGAGKMNVVELLVGAGLVKSKSEARRAVEQGGVHFDGVKIDAIDTELSIPETGAVLQKGKRHFVRVTQ